jgi:hypothetical protein
VAEARGQFGNPEEEGRQKLEAVTRGEMNTQHYSCGVVDCRLCRSMICYRHLQLRSGSVH